MIIRPMQDNEIVLASYMALDNWGPASADRMCAQAMLGLRGGAYDPKFFVADIGEGIVGFSAYQRSMRMLGSYDLIWLAVHPTYQARGVGVALTWHRIDKIKELGGQSISLVTQKPKYFGRFGFMTACHLGNDWVEMVCQLKLASMS